MRCTAEHKKMLPSRTDRTVVPHILIKGNPAKIAVDYNRIAPVLAMISSPFYGAIASPSL